MRRPALLIIDMLNDFLYQWPTDKSEALISATNQLIALARKKAMPIIWVRQEFEPDLSDAFLEMKKKNTAITIKGTRGSHIVDSLQKIPEDTVVVKKRYSAFFQTDLEQVLRNARVGSLIIAGINTHACIRMTAIDAYQRDWEVTIAKDCVGSSDQEHHNITLRYFEGNIAEVMTNEEIRRATASH
jgi:nicotinamidase-related amidase